MKAPVCIVSHHAHDRDALVELLSDYGWLSCAVSTLREATTWCREHGRAIVLLDSALPELARAGIMHQLRCELRGEFGTATLVLLGDDPHGYSQFVDACIENPVHVVALVALLQKIHHSASLRNFSAPEGGIPRS